MHNPQPGNRSAAETAQQYMSSAQDYMSDAAEHASEYLSERQEQMRGMIRGREGTALIAAVAAGACVGLIIGAALGRSHSETLTRNARRTAEGFGRQLIDRIEAMIPDALADHFAKS
jgi:hypothetical protein